MSVFQSSISAINSSFSNSEANRLMMISGSGTELGVGDQPEVDCLPL
jgi:hypothetical protein